MQAAREAALPLDEVLRRLETTPEGLSDAEAQMRPKSWAKCDPGRARRTRSPHSREYSITLSSSSRRSALLSLVLHDRSDAPIILAIVLSVGLSFANEFSSRRLSPILRARVQRKAIVVRSGKRESVDVADLVPPSNLQSVTSFPRICG